MSTAELRRELLGLRERIAYLEKDRGPSISGAARNPVKPRGQDVIQTVSQQLCSLVARFRK